MRTSAKLGLTAFMAALLLASAIGTASARSFSITSQTIRATYRRLEFAPEFPGPVVSCPVTLEGSFHSRSFAKVRSTLIGAITRAAAREASCTNGRVILESLPWHLTYESFTGLLPNITTLQVLVSRFRLTLSVSARVCTYGTATDNLTFRAVVNGSAEFTELLQVEGRNRFNLVEGFCNGPGSLAASIGEGAITALNASTRIRLTLI